MLFESDDFEIEVDGAGLAVHVHTMGERTVFQITFPEGDDRQPLMIMRMKTFEGKKMWTSVPEGRMPEAQKIGPKIVEHFKNQQ